MLKPFKILFFLLLSLNAWGDNFIEMEKLPKAENRLMLGLSDFKIEIENLADIKIKTILDKNSLGWFRYDGILLLPKARLKIRTKRLSNQSYISYKDRTINFQHSSKYSYAELNISLFEKHLVRIKQGDNDQVKIRVLFKRSATPKPIVDYTCSRNNIEIEGLTDEFFSIGCRTKRIGAFGKEKPMLEIMWMSPQLRIKDAEYLPYQAAFLSKRPVKITVQDIETGVEKVLTIKASIPQRLHRLFTAYGFGPYAFDTEYMNEEGEMETKSEPAVPALMFYINYKISEKNSIRGFDAAVFKDSVFNNAGLYLGSDFGFALDGKLYFSTLFGVQYLYYQFDEDSEVISEPIFPQGIEFMYRHAFDIPNYIVSGGIFLDPSESIDYTNVWIRWGKNYFWELNLISWGKENFKASTYGVSVGFPFKGFL